MARTTAGRGGRRVAVTGATGDLGALLLPRLEDDPSVEHLLALDIARPEQVSGKLDYRRLDLALPDADKALAAVLREHRIDTVYHLTFLWSPIQNSAFAHELEVIGSLHVLAAVAAAAVKRLVLPSLTAVYGAQSNNPAFIDERAPLRGCPPSRFISDKVEVEKEVRAFRARHPQTQVLVLRFAPIMGPSVDNPVTRLLRAKVLPTVLGYDPLWQAIHEDDAARALHLALDSPAEGELNVVGEGVLSLSGMVKMAGGRVVPLPHPLARAAIRLMDRIGRVGVPLTLLDYIRYSWVADGRRARETLGFSPRFHTREAVSAAIGGA
ncbi:MAG: NAD-dependent epimerase/dehydratase family protein [Myxococcaceae bacterium]|nr:NAD-dependent epimerase/dehydratase family protein [Myxococcaceae bacterium]